MMLGEHTMIAGASIRRQMMGPSVMERLAFGEAVQENNPMSSHGGMPIGPEAGMCVRSNF